MSAACYDPFQLLLMTATGAWALVVVVGLIVGLCLTNRLQR